jgi:uncharacterized membrane protein HdeD (DUF308 family)
MNQPPPVAPAGRSTPRWFYFLIGCVGLLAGGLYLFSAMTTGPLLRNVIIGGIFAGMGVLWIVVGVILPGARDRSS